jgi:hypothetical protein
LALIFGLVAASCSALVLIAIGIPLLIWIMGLTVGFSMNRREAVRSSRAVWAGLIGFVGALSTSLVMWAIALAQFTAARGASWYFSWDHVVSGVLERPEPIALSACSGLLAAFLASRSTEGRPQQNPPL